MNNTVIMERLMTNISLSYEYLCKSVRMIKDNKVMIGKSDYEKLEKAIELINEVSENYDYLFEGYEG